jgi:hypothetical protein
MGWHIHLKVQSHLTALVHLVRRPSRRLLFIFGPDDGLRYVGDVIQDIQVRINLHFILGLRADI